MAQAAPGFGTSQERARTDPSEDRSWVPVTAWAVCLLVGVLDIAAALTPRLWARLRVFTQFLPGTISDATIAALLVVGIGFVLLAGGLRRRKRRAWQLTVLLLAASTVLHVGAARHFGLGLISLAMLVVLLIWQGEFYAVGDPYTRWAALRYFVVLLPVSIVLGVIVAYGFREHFADTYGLGTMIQDVAVGLVGIESRLTSTDGVRPDIVYYALLGLGLVTFGTALFLLLRAPRPLPLLTEDDEDQMRELLRREGARDSLGYFALRRDKSVVWSSTRKACIAYRVTAGVMLASGDPLGDPEAWPGAIATFVDEAKRHAWIPAVVACSETGAEIWAREVGLDVLEIGDEAVVDTADFSLDGRSMRNVRQMVNRVSRAGYECELRRIRDLGPEDLEELRRCAASWRVGDIERGYSMALGRFGDPEDADCVVALARQAGTLKAMLAFVPWGPAGLSLDLMRRDRESDPGVNELLIVHTLRNAPSFGVETVSLNFAVFRGSLARGERIGATPGIRAWRRILLIASRWAQIESLYRFNAKFQPAWEPRFILYPGVTGLPRVAVAYLEAEAFITYPHLAFWRGRGRRASSARIHA
jgi:lysyl-tRNA synthetase, class II